MRTNRVRIVSDGSPRNTQIWVDGEQLFTCTKATWTTDATGFATATLELINVGLDVTTDGDSEVKVLGTAATMAVTSSPIPD